MKPKHPYFSSRRLEIMARLLGTEGLNQIYPGATRSGEWCKARCPAKFHDMNICTRVKGHDGPHIDYNYSTGLCDMWGDEQ